MNKKLLVMREIRLTAFELVIIPGLAITSLIILTSEKFAKKVRNNINTMKGYY